MANAKKPAKPTLNQIRGLIILRSHEGIDATAFRELMFPEEGGWQTLGLLKNFCRLGYAEREGNLYHITELGEKFLNTNGFSKRETTA